MENRLKNDRPVAVVPDVATEFALSRLRGEDGRLLSTLEGWLCSAA